MNEETVCFGAENLLGVVSRPAASRGDAPGIVLLNPGLLHRVGPNRLYVKIARALAADGFTVLRFDFSGLGESPQRTDHLPREQSIVLETKSAIEYLLQETDCARVLLIGHCSGAFGALLTAFSEPRVDGVIAISPEGGNREWIEYDRRQKEARYYANYYAHAAGAGGGRWRRIFTGKADYRSIAQNLFRNIIWYRLVALRYRLRNASGQAAQAPSDEPVVAVFKAGLRTLAERQLPILLIHPDQSAGLELLRAVLGNTIEELRNGGNLQLAEIPESDHLFTLLASQRALLGVIRQWVRTLVVSRAAAITLPDAASLGAPAVSVESAR